MAGVSHKGQKDQGGYYADACNVCNEGFDTDVTCDT